MKKLAVLLVSLCFLGCEKNPVNTKQTNNPEVEVSLLFEHDGVKVYRFRDNGSYIYYTDVSGRTSWSQREGRATRDVAVETVEKP